MTTRDPECQCQIGPDMVWAGPAIQLCPHSSAAEAEEIRGRLMDLLQNFAQNIDPNRMFDKTIIQLAEDYRKQAAGRLKGLMNEDEHHIVTINFMRNLSLAAQMLTCTMIINRKGGSGEQPSEEGPSAESPPTGGGQEEDAP